MKDLKWDGGVVFLKKMLVYVRESFSLQVIKLYSVYFGN